MGSINAARKKKLKGIETVRPYFEGAGEDAKILYGAELELMLMTSLGASKGFRLANDKENLALTEAVMSLKKNTIDVSNEPGAHMIEIKTDPHKLPSIENVSREILTGQASILAQAQELDIVASPFAVMPFASEQACMDNIISKRKGAYNDRPRLMTQAFRQVMGATASAYSVINTAVHGTHDVKSVRHAFEMSRMQAALLPFFFILTENRPPYQFGQKGRVKINTSIDCRRQMIFSTGQSERRALIPDFTYAARNEDDFIGMLIDTVLNSPMAFYYDDDYRFKVVPKGKIVTPMDMQGLGPQDMAQFELALSGFWWCFKYKLPTEDKVGFLHELRDFDSGPEVVANISLIAGMLAANDMARFGMFEKLEQKYGIPILSDPAEARRVIQENMDGAYHRGDKQVHGTDRHMEIPFGSKKHTMLDFLRADLLPMLEDQYKGTPASDLLQDLRFKASTGVTNTQLWYDNIKSMAQQTRIVRDMVADKDAYNMLYNQSKSWAQHYDEGNLPYVKPPKASKSKQAKAKAAKPKAAKPKTP